LKVPINPLNHAHEHRSKNTKGTFQFFRNFQLRFNLIFNEKIIEYSRTFAPQVQTPWNQAHAHLLVESFPKTPRIRSEASHKYKTKQNKLPSFIDRYHLYVNPPLGSGKLCIRLKGLLHNTSLNKICKDIYARKVLFALDFLEFNHHQMRCP